jgi:nucleotide-binding universal stress UspA family protein
MRRPDVRVLNPTDGRPPAAAAAGLLASLVDPRSVEVTVLHVDEYGNRLVADRFAAEVIDQALRRLRYAGFTAGSKRARGSIKRAIERELTDGGYTLVVLGAGNTGSIGRLILGGVSTFVVHRSTVPTVVVQRPPIEGRQRLRTVVGTDGSREAGRSIEALIAVASPERCDVSVRSVVEGGLPAAQALPDTAEMATEPSDAPDRQLDEETENAERYVAEAVERFRQTGFRCDGDVVRGRAEVALLDAVRERDADLVALGTRGRGRFAGMALGSVSAHLLRTSPATLVAPDADARSVDRADPPVPDPSA